MSSNVSISRLHVERYESGFSIAHPAPRLSWRYSGTSKDWTQKGYIVRISGQEIQPQQIEFTSDQNINVAWPFDSLVSKQKVKIGVKAFGTDGSETNWMEEDVEVALLNKKDWVAKVISGEPQPFDKPKLPTYFRTTFGISPGKLGSARIYATAYGIYTLELNGKRVGNHFLSPGWQVYEERIHSQTYDVSSMLVEGDNTLGIIAGEGWYSGGLAFGTRNLWGKEIGVVAQLEVDGRVVTKTEASGNWEWAFGAITGGEIYNGETYDSRLDKGNWAKKGQADWNWKPVKDLPFTDAEFIFPEAPPVREIMTKPIVDIHRSSSGKLILDFGQNLVGFLRFLVEPAVESGQTITIRHAEVLEHGELGTRPLKEAKATDTLVTGGTLKGWYPKFTFHGFRYAEITGWVPKMGDLEAVVIHSDMEQTGTFDCSHEMINQLHNNVIWSMRSNFVSLPTDCPQRAERLGWTGDLQVFAPTGNFLFDTSGMLGNWMHDVKADQHVAGTGLPGMVVPDVFKRGGSLLSMGKGKLMDAQAVWQDLTALTPRDLYVAFGDQRFIRDQFDSMREWLDVGIPRGANGLWDTTAIQFGDWLAPDTPPADAADTVTDALLVADAYLIHVTEAVADMAEIISQPDEAKRYRQDAIKYRQLFQDEYVSKVGRLSSDSQTAYILALRFQLLSKEQIPKAVERLRYMINKRKFRIWTGFAGVNVFLQTLADHGELNLAYRMLQEKECPSWLYPVTMGATTIWERWDSMLPDGTINPGEMTSFNHYALGSVANFLHSYVGGISPLSPGWKRILIKPQPGGSLTNAKVTHLGPYGLIECSWAITGHKLKVKINVPPNSTAVIELPGMKVEVGSGHRHYEVDWKKDANWPPKWVGSWDVLQNPKLRDDGLVE